MKYFTHNQLKISVNGTWGRGQITCDFDQLNELFGKPMDNGFDDYKSDAEWHIQFEDGEIATIYNWKNGKNYLGDDGLELWEITDWNVGGTSDAVVDRLRSIIQEDVTGKAAALPLP